MHNHLMKWTVNLEDLIIHLFNISSILRITNELQKKLYEPLPIVPIRIDCNCGRFFNSNSPPKSLKLNWPIWMDFNDSQFNMWNDFDSSSPKPFFFWANDLFPIFRHFNRFNPLIWNVFTECFHWSKTITANFDWFNLRKSREIKYCVINIITSPIRKNYRCNRWIHRLNII